MDTIQRNSSSVDKLTSLVSKMNMKMDTHEMQYKPQVYQGRNIGQNRHRQDSYQTRNRSCSRDKNQSYRGRGNYNRNYRSNYRCRSWYNYKHDNRRDNLGIMIGEITIDKMIDMTIIGKNIDKIITETTIGQIMEETIIENRDIELEVKVGKS